MFDPTLINKMESLVKKEKFIKRPRIKGVITKKKLTKKGNIYFVVRQRVNEIPAVALKTHKECYEIAEKLNIGAHVYVEGFRKINLIICTKLKIPLKEMDFKTKQIKLVDV